MKMSKQGFTNMLRLASLILFLMVLGFATCNPLNAQASVVNTGSISEIPDWNHVVNHPVEPIVERGLYWFEATIDEIYDADTFWAIVKMPNVPKRGDYKDWKYERIKIRLWKCDTHELKCRGKRFKDWTIKEKRIEEAKGRKAKNFAIDNWGGKDVTVLLAFRDVYRDSRWVCTVYCEDGETMKQKLKWAGLLTGKYEK